MSIFCNLIPIACMNFYILTCIQLYYVTHIYAVHRLLRSLPLASICPLDFPQMSTLVPEACGIVFQFLILYILYKYGYIMFLFYYLNSTIYGILEFINLDSNSDIPQQTHVNIIQFTSWWLTISSSISDTVLE